MKLLASLVALLALLVPTLAWGAPEVARPRAHSRASPPGGTVVAVRGDRHRGFRIRYYDGSVDVTPPVSRARAECGESERRLERVRCRTAVRVGYRDLGRLRQAIDYAHRAS
jgi:hypothetical protein